MEALKKWNAELGGVLAEALEGEKNGADADAGENLKRKFGNGAQAEIAVQRDFFVVVDKADGTESDSGAESEHGVGISKVGPKQSGNGDGYDDENAAHGGRAGFGLVRLGTFFANELLDLKSAKLFEDPGLHGERENQRGDAGDGGADGNVAEHVEGANVWVESVIEEVVEHFSSLVRRGDGLLFFLHGDDFRICVVIGAGLWLRVFGAKCGDDFFHFDAAGTFDEKEVAGLDESGEELGGLIGGVEETRVVVGLAGGDGSVNEIVSVAADAD